MSMFNLKLAFESKYLKFILQHKQVNKATNVIHAPELPSFISINLVPVRRASCFHALFTESLIVLPKYRDLANI